MKKKRNSLVLHKVRRLLCGALAFLVSANLGQSQDGPARHAIATGRSEVLEEQTTIHACANSTELVRGQFGPCHSRPVLPASAFEHSSNIPSTLRRSSTARTATSTASSAAVTSKTSIFKAIDKCLQKHASNLGRSANTELRDTVTPCQICSEPQTRLSRPTLIRININEDGNATHQTRMQGRQSPLH